MPAVSNEIILEKIHSLHTEIKLRQETVEVKLDNIKSKIDEHVPEIKRNTRFRQRWKGVAIALSVAGGLASAGLLTYGNKVFETIMKLFQ